jgi:hypothetical protein
MAKNKQLLHVVELIESGRHEGDLVLTDADEKAITALRDEYLAQTDTPLALDFIGFLYHKGVKLVEFQYDIVSLEKK